MKRRTAFLLVLASATAGVTGCENVGALANSPLGAQISGVAGTVAPDLTKVGASLAAAKQICKDDASGMCTAMTATAIAGFTDAIIQKLKESDVQSVAAAREEAIRTGKPQEWKNTETGASGSVEATAAPSKPAEEIKIKAQTGRITSLPELDAVGQPYVVTAASGASVRGSAEKTAPTVETLPKGERITAFGKVRGGEGFLIGRGDVAIGFVDAATIAPAPLAPPKPATPQATPPATPKPPAAPPATDLATKVTAECYTTKQKVTLADGTSEQASVTSCRTPTGWKQV